MTENEKLKCAIHCMKVIADIGVCEECEAYTEGDLACRDIAREAFKALEEVQEYRKLGTLEELARANKYIDLAKKHGTIGEMIDECAEYEAIGTVEECREAVDKQKPKAPKDSLKIKPVIDENGSYVDADVTVYLLCPNCGEMVGIDENVDKFCHECGQAIQWNENLEGMEYE